jgi:hypothetical protein
MDKSQSEVSQIVRPENPSAFFPRFQDEPVQLVILTFHGRT